MSMTWHEYFFRLMDLAAQKSKDPTTPVGAVVVGPDKEIRATGFNGFPRGVKDSEERYADRTSKLLYIEHAERNAIYNAARIGVSLKGCSIYLSFWPCVDCARAIIQAGITTVYVARNTYDVNAAKWERPTGGWKTGMDAGREMMAEAGVKLEVV
jgi:dCMP deaminase